MKARKGGARFLAEEQTIVIVLCPLLATKISQVLYCEWKTARTRARTHLLINHFILKGIHELRKLISTLISKMVPNDSDDFASANASTVSEFSPIDAPFLPSVNPIQVAKFVKERKRYGLEIEAKQAEIPGLKAIPHKASIDPTLLKNTFSWVNLT